LDIFLDFLPDLCYTLGMVVTIDGTAASGKSTTAKIVAKRLGFTYLDTGAMYRAVALYCIENEVNISDKTKIADISLKIDIRFELLNDINHIFMDGRDVTKAIRTEEIGGIASTIATYKAVRRNLVRKQRAMGEMEDLVCEGRDAGTVVFKDAQIKIYMDADLMKRAERRNKEHGEKGDFNSILETIRQRDRQDKTRKESPLIIPDGAVILDTTDLSIEEQVERVIEEYRVASSE